MVINFEKDFEITICNYSKLKDEYKALLDENKNKNYPLIFKGHSDSSWSLSTHLERCLNNYPIKKESPQKIEKNLLKEFQRKASLYLSKGPDHENIIEWNALMRHYGAPSRLLDFTYSFYVALYFAVEGMVWNKEEKEEEKEKKCAVYAINTELFESRNLKNKYQSMPYMNGTEYDSDKKRSYFLFLKKNPSCFVFQLSPYYQNERISIQQGTFLIPWNINESFEKNLEGNFSENKIPKNERKNFIKKYLIKMKIGERKEIIHDLHRMNINRATLYPGIEGFAKSLGIRMIVNE